MRPIKDHPLRYALANELHARPFPFVKAPATAVFLAIKHDDHPDTGPSSAAGRDHLIALLKRFGAAYPPPDASHYAADLGPFRLKWENHTEFMTYTAFRDGIEPHPFDPVDFELFPDDWLEEAPGQRITSALFRVETTLEDAAILTEIEDYFVTESVAVARVLDEAAILAGDFRIDPAGHMRFLVSASTKTGAARVGRVIQRLAEVETYKAMSMLGLVTARELNGKLNRYEKDLTLLTSAMSSGSTPPQEALDRLLKISAALEGLAAESSFRFGATAAYEQIVRQRISILREQRFMGQQTFGEFMMRRYDPAMRTVHATADRLGVITARAARAGELLRTRVDVERSAQNQDILKSMNERADLQLRLQRTVEGLSVVAVSYYAVSLVGYLLYPLAKPFGLSSDVLVAGATVPVVLLVWYLLRRVRRKFE